MFLLVSGRHVKICITVAVDIIPSPTGFARNLNPKAGSLRQPCIPLARMKTDLINQSSAGSKKLYCPDVNVTELTGTSGGAK